MNEELPYKLHHGKALEILSTLEDDSVGLIATDPPYFRVKDLDWDKAWKEKKQFLDWMGEVLREFHRVLKPNGSLYVFAGPEMGTAVEVEIRKSFHVLTNIRWKKPKFQSRAESSHKEGLRSYFPASESILFAEHYNSDNIAKGEAGYQKKCDELRGFVFEPLRKWFEEERLSAGLTREDVRKFFAEKLGTKGKVSGHFYDRSQYMLPTEKMYKWLQECHGNNHLRREYEDLRREYEDLRREYESLRRPFTLSKDVPYTDVWEFPTVKPFPGKHPCEKPYAMMEHIIRASSREGDTVLDAFCGSGVTGEAAIRNNRKFIGIDMQDKWIKKTWRRIEMIKYELPLVVQ